MFEEETNNFSIVAALQPPLPLVPSKTTLIPPLRVPTPVTTISDAAVGTLAAAFLSLSTKGELNSILNRK